MEHRCRALPGNGLGVYRAEHFLNGKNWEWCLVVQRLATESDLEENHHLENIGDTMWTTAVGISYCPFCGACFLTLSIPCHRLTRSINMLITVAGLPRFSSGSTVP